VLLVGGLVVVVAVFAAVLLLNRSHGSPAEKGVLVSDNAYAFWVDPDKKHVVPQLVAGPNGEKALEVDFTPGRTYFTLLQANFARPKNWTSEPAILLDFRGSGSGKALQFVVDFAADNSSFAVFDLLDTSSSWRQVAFVRAKPDAVAGRAHWNHVVNLRIVGASKDAEGAFKLGPLRLGSASG
jgi:hypothetical protein